MILSALISIYLTIGIFIYGIILSLVIYSYKRQSAINRYKDDESQTTTLPSTITSQMSLEGKQSSPKFYTFTKIGKFLYNSLLVLPLVGELFLIILCILSYFPNVYMDLGFIDWDDICGIWIYLFILTNVMLVIIVTRKDKIQRKFMIEFSAISETISNTSNSHYVLITDNLKGDSPLGEDLSATLDEDSCENLGHKSFWQKTLMKPKIVLSKSTQKMKSIFKRKVVIRRTLCEIETKVIDGDCETVTYYEHNCLRYIYNKFTNTFDPTGTVMSCHTFLTSSTETVTMEHSIQNARSKLYEAHGHNDSSAQYIRNITGPNTIAVQVPTILQAIGREFCNIIYIYQSVGAWSYIIYTTWNIGSIWAAMMILSGLIKSLYIVRPNFQRIAKLANRPTTVLVLRNGEWIRIPSTELVVGDCFAIQNNNVDDSHVLIPVDAILLCGNVIVDESSLTGEPMPISKVPVEINDLGPISYSHHRKNLLHSGCTVLQSSLTQDDIDQDEKLSEITSNSPSPHLAIAYCIATGGNTTKGELVRMVLYPSVIRFKYNDQLPLVFFILFCYAMILSVALLINSMGSWVVTFFIMMANIAQAINPMLPVSLVIGQSMSSSRLSSKEINCLAPDRIPIAGKVSTMVFDKTGTITKEGIDFIEGVPVKGDKFSTDNKTSLLTEGLGCCHAVTALNNGTLVGNHVEVSMFSHSEYCFMKNNEGDYNFNQIISKTDANKVINIHRILEFDQTRVTSGSVVEVDGKTYCFIKGSYEKIKSLCHNVPVNYDAFCEEKASENYYVLSMAVKEITDVNMSRDEFEKDLELIGILLFRNEIKPDSAKAINDLKIGNTNCIICTGDNALTGASIGLQCGILSEDKRILHIEEEANGSYIFKNHFSGENISMSDLDADDQLIVSGNTFKRLNASQELSNFSDQIKVYARMKPNDKVDVITHYQQVKKLVVGMCGDGGNDCGALRAAHIGHALSEGEASMVAPFSSGRDGKSLQTVVDIIREGRACLSTNMATFQYYMVYAFVVTFVKTFLVILGNFLMSVLAYITNDVYVGIIMVWAMTFAKPNNKPLAPYRPTASLLGIRTVSSVLFFVLIAWIALFVSWGILWNTSFYDYKNTLDIYIPGQLWPRKSDNYDAAVGFIVVLCSLSTAAFSLSMGGAFRQSIFKNIPLLCAYSVAIVLILFSLFFGVHQDFSGVYRINSDTPSSLATYIPVLSEFASGGTGGCFLGPQISQWQKIIGDNTGDYKWLPEPETNCLPPQYVLDILPEKDLSKVDECIGANNCFDEGYTWTITTVLISMIVIYNLFAKVVMLGPVASYFRQRKQGDM